MNNPYDPLNAKDGTRSVLERIETYLAGIAAGLLFFAIYVIAMLARILFELQRG